MIPIGTNADNTSYVKLPTSLASLDVSYIITGARIGGFFVYRFYDAAGQAIYIGQTKNPTSRMSQHGCNRCITSRASRLVFEEHDSRDAAKMMEASAIGAELPLLNVHCKPSPDFDETWSDWDKRLVAKYGDAEIRRWDRKRAKDRAAKLRHCCSCCVCEAAAADHLANPYRRPYQTEVAS